MISVYDLQKDREEAFDVWFERWWAREDLECKIKIANCQGYTSLLLVLSNYGEYEQRRMSNDRFMLKLKEMLPGFEMEFEYRTNWLTKKEYLYGIKIWWNLVED